MNRVIYILFAWISTISISNAQKEDLIKWSSDYEKLYGQKKSVHINYRLTVASAEDTSKQSILVDLYSSDGKDYIKMEEMQEIVHDGKIILVVNHENKLVSISNDTSNVTSKHILISDFKSIIDSATTVSSIQKEGKVFYRLAFSKTYVYSSLELFYSKKTKSLLYIKATFNKFLRPDFDYIEVKYNEPVWTWVPDSSFPYLNKFIEIRNGEYFLIDKYDDYKLF